MSGRGATTSVIVGPVVLDMLTEAVTCLPDGTGVAEAVDGARMIWLGLHGRATIEYAMPWLDLSDEHDHIT